MCEQNAKSTDDIGKRIEEIKGMRNASIKEKGVEKKISILTKALDLCDGTLHLFNWSQQYAIEQTNRK